MATNNSINQPIAVPVPATPAKGGTGLATLTDKNAIVGAGEGNVEFIAPGTSGNVLKSNGTNWESAAPAGGSITGMITLWSTTTAPTGWLLCDGATVSQATYAALYAVIAHTFGADPGGGNFILPNFKGKVPVKLLHHHKATTLSVQ